MSARPDIKWNVGVSDESYGTQVWISRIQNLQCHLRIIGQHLPETKMGEWLGKQVAAAMREADAYIADAVPSDDQEQAA